MKMMMMMTLHSSKGKMNNLSIVGSIVNIIAMVLNARGDKVLPWYLWGVSNTVLLILAAIRGDIGQVMLWTAYSVINLKMIVQDIRRREK